MVVNVEKNYAKFKKYIQNYIKREGVNEFLEWLDSSDMRVAPASTKYHMSCEGGLCAHSLNVFYRLIKLIQAEYPEGTECPYSQESIALVALLHDLAKVNYYTISEKNVKNAQGQWEKVPYYTVKDTNDRLIFGSHSMNGYYLASKFFKLTYDEELAILHHMGGLDTTEDTITLKNTIDAYKKSTLALLLHQADMLATCIDELEEETNE